MLCKNQTISAGNKKGLKMSIHPLLLYISEALPEMGDQFRCENDVGMLRNEKEHEHSVASKVQIQETSHFLCLICIRYLIIQLFWSLNLPILFLSMVTSLISRWETMKWSWEVSLIIDHDQLTIFRAVIAARVMNLQNWLVACSKY